MWSRLHSFFIFIVDIFKSYQQHWGLTSHASITFRKNVFYLDLKVVSVLEIFEFPNFTMLHFMTSSSAWQVNTGNETWPVCAIQGFFRNLFWAMLACLVFLYVLKDIAKSLLRQQAWVWLVSNSSYVLAIFYTVFGW